MRNVIMYILLAVCAALELGYKLAFGDEALHKSSMQVMPKVAVTSTAQAPTVVTGKAASDYSTYILTMVGTANTQGLPVSLRGLQDATSYRLLYPSH